MISLLSCKTLAIILTLLTSAEIHRLTISPEISPHPLTWMICILLFPRISLYYVFLPLLDRMLILRPHARPVFLVRHIHPHLWNENDFLPRKHSTAVYNWCMSRSKVSCYSRAGSNISHAVVGSEPLNWCMLGDSPLLICLAFQRCRYTWTTDYSFWFLINHYVKESGSASLMER